MEGMVRDRAAVDFAREFYTSLTDGDSIGNAFDSAKAAACMINPEFKVILKQCSIN